MSDNLRSKVIRLAASMPKGSSERKALLNVLAKSQRDLRDEALKRLDGKSTFRPYKDGYKYEGSSSFQRKAEALAISIWEKTRHQSHAPEEIIDESLASGRPLLHNDVLNDMWRLVNDNPYFIEGYGKLDWNYLQEYAFDRQFRGSPWGAPFWKTFLKEAERKL